MIRLLAGGNHPGHLSELVVGDVSQDLGLIQDDVLSPIGAGADKLTALNLGQANVLDRVGTCPYGAAGGRVVAPRDVLRVE